ncbi:MAG: hypothetical protein O6700_09750 [Gammaproteobacteria bacterium]|nr:hypothetical protein [Gammaproteobacteria bacterium]MCZ6497350.1 hypothetical protein [Gammaproteobacteria bacterium]MCZ6584759.1 hypothetical protein [Gammaproteobacteria bacterium]
MTDGSSLTKHPYEIVSVRRADPPPNTEGSDWHCYVITQGSNVIHGYRQGQLKVVTKAVEEIVARLNDRRTLKPGRVHLVLTSKKKIAPTPL